VSPEEAKQKYDELISFARSQERKKVKGGTYYECHHILPRKMGGTNDEENLVLLLHREHFVAHQLLVDVCPVGSPERAKAAFAVHKMTHGKQSEFYDITPEEYERTRIMNVEAMQGNTYGKSYKVQNTPLSA